MDNTPFLFLIQFLCKFKQAVKEHLDIYGTRVLLVYQLLEFLHEIHPVAVHTNELF